MTEESDGIENHTYETVTVGTRNIYIFCTRELFINMTAAYLAELHCKRNNTTKQRAKENKQKEDSR